MDPMTCLKERYDCVTIEIANAVDAAVDAREVRGAQDRSATHNSANLPDYLDFGVYSFLQKHWPRR